LTIDRSEIDRIIEVPDESINEMKDEPEQGIYFQKRTHQGRPPAPAVDDTDIHVAGAVSAADIHHRLL